MTSLLLSEHLLEIFPCALCITKRTKEEVILVEAIPQQSISLTLELYIEVHRLESLLPNRFASKAKQKGIHNVPICVTWLFPLGYFVFIVM